MSGSFPMECICAQIRPVYTLLRRSFLGNGVRTHVNSNGKIPSTGGSEKGRSRIRQHKEPNTQPNEPFRPLEDIQESVSCEASGLTGAGDVDSDPSISCSGDGHISCSPHGHISCSRHGHLQTDTSPALDTDTSPDGHISCSRHGHISCSRHGHISCSRHGHISCSRHGHISCSPHGHISCSPDGRISCSRVSAGTGWPGVSIL